MTVALALITVAGPAHAKDADKEEAKEKTALLQTVTIRKACEQYYLNPNSGGTYPKKLEDLIKPPWGGSSFLANGKDNLLDPWAKAFKYELAKDAKGFDKPFIWAERTVNGKTKVIGAKPPEKK
jgi:hypothetical protein